MVFALVAPTAWAIGDEGTPIDTSEYTIDLHQGPVTCGSRVVGLAGAYEAILIRDGLVTEGAASNVFVVDDHGHLLTPPADHRVLPGITRDVVLELAAQAGLPHAEAPIDRERLARAREIWLTSSTREIVPVGRLDDRPIGDGAPGPVWHRLHRLYRAFTERLRDGGDERI